MPVELPWLKDSLTGTELLHALIPVAAMLGTDERLHRKITFDRGRACQPSLHMTLYHDSAHSYFRGAIFWLLR